MGTILKTSLQMYLMSLTTKSVLSSKIQFAFLSIDLKERFENEISFIFRVSIPRRRDSPGALRHVRLFAHELRMYWLVVLKRPSLLLNHVLRILKGSFCSFPFHPAIYLSKRALGHQGPLLRIRGLQTSISHPLVPMPFHWFRGDTEEHSRMQIRTRKSVSEILTWPWYQNEQEAETIEIL